MFDKIFWQKRKRRNIRNKFCRQKFPKCSGEASINTNDPEPNKQIRRSNNPTSLQQPLAPGILRDFTREHLEPFRREQSR